MRWSRAGECRAGGCTGWKSGEAARRDYLAADSAPAPKLGTGHGERESSYVQETEFQRQQPGPNEVIRIRYDSMDNLVALGVVRRLHAAAEPPRGLSRLAAAVRTRSAGGVSIRRGRLLP